MANTDPLPLQEKIPRKNTIQRAVDLIILFLLFSLLVYRLLSLKDHGFAWLLAFFCESWFTFNWIFVVNMKWLQLDFKTHPERLLQQKNELPAVDMFVTTADPELEPPIITVNTVLSLLAVDYPANKLACYVSDDACSPLTYYSLVEASKFAKLWVPFCKKYNIHLRAPFRYFASKHRLPGENLSEFQEECTVIKGKYEQLCQKIEDAAQSAVPLDLEGELAVFSKAERRNHATIIKVIWENKEGLENGLPHLVYISREKRPKHPHHFKAGAMNALTRVSGVMTNARFMLNVDCDMYAHNPQVVYHAMCVLLGHENERECAYVQFPQLFYDGLKDDPFGNQLTCLHEYMGRGIASIQGPFYGGTSCFHRRKVIYGLSPDDNEMNGELDNVVLQKRFGNSTELSKLAHQSLSGSSSKTDGPRSLSAGSVHVAHQVAGCGYEYGTSWGKEVGWMYGSTTEDVLTGLSIQGKGWRSGYCTPDPPAFLGCSTPGGPASMTQQKRWATGLLEILVHPKGPLIATLEGELQIRQCLCYLWIILWGPRGVAEICYAVLPAYCIITNSGFLPKLNEPAMLIPLALFVIYNIYSLLEYFQMGLSIGAWWNNQRSWRVNAMCAWSFGTLSVALKLLGLSETVFEITKKDQTQAASGNENDSDAGRFTFNNSPYFIPGTTILLLNMTALVTGLLGLRQDTHVGPSWLRFGMGEIICSLWVVMTLWAFLRGLFGKGIYGIPLPIIFRSGALALLFVLFCKWTSTS